MSKWEHPSDHEYSDGEILSNRKKWTDALRSGEFQQARGVLHATLEITNEVGKTGHCCLGVACEVMGVGRALGGSGYVFNVVHTTTLPSYFLNAFGLSLEDQEQLIRMNDGLMGLNRKSFQEIADYIDKLPIYRGQK